MIGRKVRLQIHGMFGPTAYEGGAELLPILMRLNEPASNAGRYRLVATITNAITGEEQTFELLVAGDHDHGYHTFCPACHRAGYPRQQAEVQYP